MIKLKKILLVEGVLPPTCYKCAKYKASFYLVRKTIDQQQRSDRTEENREIHVPLCNVCLSAFLNYLDDKIIKWHYDFTHKENNNDKKR
jgi:hypothetical protein